jgi:hypothetical protein
MDHGTYTLEVAYCYLATDLPRTRHRRQFGQPVLLVAFLNLRQFDFVDPD